MADNQQAIVDWERAGQRVAELVEVQRPRYRRLWGYFRNPMRLWAASTTGGSERPYRQAQEWGLPARITGVRPGSDLFTGETVGDIARKEVVIENDIGWRVETMGDYLFGKPLSIHSAAPDPDRRDQISHLLRAMLAYNGGVVFLQQLAVIGSVYGFVDVLVKLQTGIQQAADVPEGMQELGEPPVGEGRAVSPPSSDTRPDSAGPSEIPPMTGPASAAEETPPAAAPSHAAAMQGSAEPANTGASTTSRDSALERIARMIRLEIVEPARALPFLAAEDWRVVEAYGQCWEIERTAGGDARAPRRGWVERLRASFGGWFGVEKGLRGGGPRVRILELISPDRWQRWEDATLVAEGANSLGRIPLVHIQNTAVPLEYSGGSEVEPLIPLQDELNTRLSDRAHRIALQSLKMYLGKCVDGFVDQPISPGRMWETSNPDAAVTELGGDSACPSEETHISDLREALDKTSGVTPIAAGAIKNRIGRLTSAAALRITLLALLSKTDKKRLTYGAGIESMCELALAWLDRAGLFRTSDEERRIELHWPSPLPENQQEKLDEAEAKLRIGVGKEVVLKELGY